MARYTGHERRRGSEIAHAFLSLSLSPGIPDCLYRSGEARGAYRSTLESEFKVAHLVSEAAPRTRATTPPRVLRLSRPRARSQITTRSHALHAIEILGDGTTLVPFVRSSRIEI